MSFFLARWRSDHVPVLLLNSGDEKDRAIKADIRLTGLQFSFSEDYCDDSDVFYFLFCRCKMFPDMSFSETTATIETFVVGLAPQKM